MSGLLVFFGIVCLIYQGIKEAMQPRRKAIKRWLEGKFFLVKNAQETALQVGDTVKEGDVICYVEAMKTYNAIRAEFGGTVTAICANPGDAISEDDVLMRIG